MTQRQFALPASGLAQIRHFQLAEGGQLEEAAAGIFCGCGLLLALTAGLAVREGQRAAATPPGRAAGRARLRAAAVTLSGEQTPLDRRDGLWQQNSISRVRSAE